MYPYLLPEFFGQVLPLYGLMTALGYFAAILYCLQNKQRFGGNKDLIMDIGFYLILGALIGGKILFIILNWDTFSASGLIEKLRYGFVFFGGLIGAGIAGVLTAKKYKVSFFKGADFFAPAVALGHSLGRVGCFLAGCCYGKPTTSPIGVIFNSPHTLVPEHLHQTPLYPVQLIEAIAVFILFLILNKLAKKPTQTGTLTAVYVLGYALIRFSTEFMRADDRGAFIAGLSPSQIIALALAAAITVFLVKRKYAK